MNRNEKMFNPMALTLCLAGALLLGMQPSAALAQFDFSGLVWAGAQGQESYTVGCVTADADPEDFYSDHYLFWDSVDGLGVTSPYDTGPTADPTAEPDEIDSPEPFQIRFCRPTYVAGIRIADLYPKYLSNGAGSEWVDWGGRGDGSGEDEGETGWVVPDESWDDRITFVGDDSTESNGEQYVPLGMVVTTLDFYTICTNSDYSVISVDPYVHIEIDIKPGSYPNSINVRKEGVVPVAILTTDDFDATMVDPPTVLFASAAPLRWAVEDVDGDEDLDLILHFETQALNLTANSVAAMLTGVTCDGVYWIKGMDSVKIVGSKSVKCLPPAPGTGTPGYWMTHPKAWPADGVCIGGRWYSMAKAIEIMWEPTKGDKTLTMFPALVAAKLNVLAGNDDSCIKDTILAADKWMEEHPVHSGVKAGSDAWQDDGEGLYMKLDAYNNGRLPCAVSRDSLESD